jgi:uncharacterized membrane protein YccC
MIGLNRALEILVGTLSSLIVTSIIWPRYAREEFFELSRKALSALLFSVLQRAFFRAGGTGDLRAFQTLFCACLILSVYTALLILITPFMANYLVMNLTLFVGLFIFGFMTARIPGFSFWSIVAILSTSVFVGLNAQEPVASSTIIDSVLGLIAGMAIATVIGRMIWPLLPQRLLRDVVEESRTYFTLRAENFAVRFVQPFLSDRKRRQMIRIPVLRLRKGNQV